MRATRSAALFGALLVGGCWQVLAAGREWAVVRTIQVGGEGGWDYLTVDPHKHLLYVPRTTETAVIDAQSGKVIAKIPGQKRAHGVAIVPEVGRGFISDGGGDGAVVIFDLKTNQVLGTVAGQPDADGIIFDSASRRVLVVSGDNGVLMPLKPDIDAKSGTLDAALDLGGKPEFLASDGQGKVYINLEDKNEVVVVDTKAMRVTARWPVAPGGAPVGLALDVKKGRLFVGCRNPHKLVVMSTADGKILADLPIGEGVDAVKLDARRSVRELSRRLTRRGARDLGRSVRNRPDRQDTAGCADDGHRPDEPHDLSPDGRLRGAEAGCDWPSGAEARHVQGGRGRAAALEAHPHNARFGHHSASKLPPSMPPSWKWSS